MDNQNITSLNAAIREQLNTTQRELRNALIIKVALLIFVVGYFSAIYCWLNRAKITGRNIPVYVTSLIQNKMPLIIDQRVKDAPNYMSKANLLIKENVPVVAANFTQDLSILPKAAPQIEQEIGILLAEKIGGFKQELRRVRPTASEEEIFNELVSLKPGSPLCEKIIMPIFEQKLEPFNDLNRQIKTLTQNQAPENAPDYQANLINTWIKLVKLSLARQ